MKTAQLPKVKAKDITGGMTIRFRKGQVRPGFNTTWNEQYKFWMGEQVETDTDYEVATVELSGSHNCTPTGRRQREYTVTLTDGRNFTMSPSQTAHVVEGD